MSDTYEYDVFGGIRAKTGTSDNEFTYTGEQNESTGLEYLRARYYDPEVGRFISQDPLPLLQRYVYVGNSPANYVDPSGLRFHGSVVGWIGDRVGDAGQAAWHTILNPELLNNGGYVNELLGAGIAALSSCDRRTKEGGIVIYENCDGLADWIGNTIGAEAYTVGSFIFSGGEINAETLLHELAHVDQYDALGVAFLPVYIPLIPEYQAACILGIHCTHPLETLADRQAGTDTY